MAPPSTTSSSSTPGIVFTPRASIFSRRLAWLSVKTGSETSMPAGSMTVMSSALLGQEERRLAPEDPSPGHQHPVAFDRPSGQHIQSGPRGRRPLSAFRRSPPRRRCRPRPALVHSSATFSRRWRARPGAPRRPPAYRALRHQVVEQPAHDFLEAWSRRREQAAPQPARASRAGSRPCRAAPLR